MFKTSSSIALMIAISILLSSPARAYIDEIKPSLEIFSGYQPLYFLVGNPDSKIEISFKAKVIRQVPLYAAYTQRSYWNLFQKSAPFLDSSYHPELFYRFELPGVHRWIDLGLLEHESNGKDGTDSRSWNRSYLRYSAMTALRSGAKLYWTLRAWVPYRYEENESILHYRGLYEVNATYANFLGPFFERGDLTLSFYSGGNSMLSPWSGGQELTLRTNISELKFLDVFVFQIFHGYAENLLHYTRNDWRARVGIGF